MNPIVYLDQHRPWYHHLLVRLLDERAARGVVRIATVE